MAAELLERIVADADVCFGRPTIRGHRVWVSTVLGYLAEGWTTEAVLVEFPALEGDDVRACLAYAALMADTRFADLDSGDKGTGVDRRPSSVASEPASE